MQGYLVTVMSAAEDNILNQVTATNIGAWSGGARCEGINDNDSVPNWTDNPAPGRTAGSVFANQSLSGSTGSGAHRRFRWQNGPETGIEYYEQGNGGSTPTGNGHALNTPYGSYSHFEPTGGVTYEPNSSGGGGPYVSGYESVMQVHNAGYWNDLHNVSEYTGGGLDVKGFYIEFSGYKRTDSTSEQVVPLHTALTVYAERSGQRYYFQTADEAVIWAGQNGNAPLTLIGDTTLTSDIPANVSLDLNGHTLTVPTSSSVVKQGYTFEGWYDNAALLGTPVTTLRTMNAENKHYYAKWSAPLQYPVRYELNDSAANPAIVPASNLLCYSIETNWGGAIQLSPAFRRGCDFLGWYDNAAFAGAPVADFPATDAVPKAYYAKWQIKSYWLQYYLNGGSGSNMPINPAVNPDRYTIEREVSLAPPQRQGYTGIWSENGQTITNIPAGSTGDRTLTAIWTLNRYPIHYELGETVNSCVEGLPALPQSYTAEDADITLPTPHRIGYTFLRWEKSSAPRVADNRIQAGSAGELTFRAIWEPIRYRIHYDTVGGTNNTQNPTTFTIEDEISPYGSVKQGMRFWTWQLVGGKFIHTIPAGTTHDIALVARYQKDRDSDNIGGGNNSGNNSGSGERQRQPLPDGVVNKKAQERKTVNAGSEDGERIEPVPQKRADARAEVLHESVSPEHGERNAKLVAATESFELHRHARLPKTGEMPFRIPMAFLLFVSLLASNLSYVLYAIRVFGKKKAEWF